jgi:(2S)-methylsuccinyl-CoA dehydrogenase
VSPRLPLLDTSSDIDGGAAMAVSDSPAVAMASALDALKRQVAEAVSRDGFDQHQVAVDHLVWNFAHVEAARAVRESAGARANGWADSIADLCETQALNNLNGTKPGDDIRLGVRLAEIADRYEPIEDLGAADDHRLLRSSLRQFAIREISPHARDIHRTDSDIPDHIISAVAKMGLLGLSVPPEFGGVNDGGDIRSMLIATEELSRASLGAGGSLMTRPEILVRALLRGGTLEQKDRWLPEIATGQKLVAVAVTEPDFGSDVAEIACRATRLPSGAWEITGTKLWCTFAGRAHLLMLLCRTADTRHKGLSVFVVEKPSFAGHEFTFTQPGGGVLRGKAIPTIGYRGMHSFELSFEQFQLPPIALVGGEAGLNQGFYLQMEGFTMGRIQTAARAVGLMQAAFEEAMTYAKDRTAFGSRLLANQLIRSKLGEMILRVHASRQLSYRAARLLENGQGQTEASLAKLFASRMAELVTREAMQIHGGIGYSDESNAARYWVDARVLAIFEGTEEVLSLRVVGRSLLRPAQQPR